jgi:hypothetical protein
VPPPKANPSTIDPAAARLVLLEGKSFPKLQLIPSYNSVDLIGEVPS